MEPIETLLMCSRAVCDAAPLGGLPLDSAQSALFPVTGPVRREHREQLLGQRGLAVWMSGLSGSGKTTLAHEAQRRLHAQRRLVTVLDGDTLRTGLNSDLGFSEAARIENLRRVAELTRVLVDTGAIVIAATISPTASVRARAKEIIGAADFLEVFVHCPLAVCEKRDVKGLYARARSGELRQFTGIDSPFEEPATPGLDLHTDQLSVEQAASLLVDAITARQTR